MKFSHPIYSGKIWMPVTSVMILSALAGVNADADLRVNQLRGSMKQHVHSLKTAEDLAVFIQRLKNVRGYTKDFKPESKSELRAVLKEISDEATQKLVIRLKAHPEEVSALSKIHDPKFFSREDAKNILDAAKLMGSDSFQKNNGQLRLLYVLASKVSDQRENLTQLLKEYGDLSLPEVNLLGVLKVAASHSRGENLDSMAQIVKDSKITDEKRFALVLGLIQNSELKVESENWKEIFKAIQTPGLFSVENKRYLFNRMLVRAPGNENVLNSLMALAEKASTPSEKMEFFGVLAAQENRPEVLSLIRKKVEEIPLGEDSSLKRNQDEVLGKLIFNSNLSLESKLDLISWFQADSQRRSFLLSAALFSNEPLSKRMILDRVLSQGRNFSSFEINYLFLAAESFPELRTRIENAVEKNSRSKLSDLSKFVQSPESLRALEQILGMLGLVLRYSENSETLQYWVEKLKVWQMPETTQTLSAEMKTSLDQGMIEMMTNLALNPKVNSKDFFGHSYSWVKKLLDGSKTYSNPYGGNDLDDLAFFLAGSPYFPTDLYPDARASASEKVFKSGMHATKKQEAVMIWAKSLEKDPTLFPILMKALHGLTPEEQFESIYLILMSPAMKSEWIPEVEKFISENQSLVEKFSLSAILDGWRPGHEGKPVIRHQIGLSSAANLYF